MDLKPINKHKKKLSSPTLHTEVTQQTKRFKKSIRRLRCIKRVYPRLFDFSDEIIKCNKPYHRPSFETLKAEYLSLSATLSERNLEVIQTQAEKSFKSNLEDYTHKKVFKTIWIGSRCVDLFIPNIRSEEKNRKKAMRGLVIEIDGDYHKLEGKQIKDGLKGEELLSLGIGTTHIYNWDFNNPSLLPLKRELKNLTTLDSRERKRLWTRIYAFTLAIYLSDADFFQIFKEKAVKGVEL